MWQRSKCAESPINQLFTYFVLWTSISEIKLRPYFSLNCTTQNLKKNLRNYSPRTCSHLMAILRALTTRYIAMHVITLMTFIITYLIKFTSVVSMDTKE